MSYESHEMPIFSAKKALVIKIGKVKRSQRLPTYLDAFCYNRCILSFSISNIQLVFKGKLRGFKGDLIHSYNKHEVLDHIKGFVRHTKVNNDSYCVILSFVCFVEIKKYIRIRSPRTLGNSNIWLVVRNFCSPLNLTTLIKTSDITDIR